MLYCRCFFFQAEDGIRDYKVTGVQTCALPISAARASITRIQAREPPPSVPASADALRACRRAVAFSRVAAWLPIAADRKSTRLNSSHLVISYAVFCLKKKTTLQPHTQADRQLQ